MPLPDVLPIQPFTRPVRGEVALPGSKSLTNRALLLAALCDQPVTLTGALFSEDTHLMAEALRKLGFTVEANEAALTLRVADQAKGFSGGDGPVALFVGLAGTAARFLTALCAAAPRGIYRLDGVAQMRKRPMKPLIDALRTLGADIRCTGEEGFFPLKIHARGLVGGEVSIDASESSQLLSALFMVAPRAKNRVWVSITGPIRWPFVNMTRAMMHEFDVGINKDVSSDRLLIEPSVYRSPGTYTVEPDATAASYFLALPLAANGAVFLPGMRPAGFGLQGDARFIDVLSKTGVRVKSRDMEVPIAEVLRSVPGLSARSLGIDSSYDKSAPRLGVTQDFSEFSDTFLTLAAISPLVAGPTRITGIAHTRKQETDRVAGMARELKKLGQDVEENEDSLTITPQPLKSGVEIETYGDHRFAMSFAILGCHDLHGDGRPWLSIKNPACCAKTFPNFFDVLAEVRRNSHSQS